MGHTYKYLSLRIMPRYPCSADIMHKKQKPFCNNDRKAHLYKGAFLYIAGIYRGYLGSSSGLASTQTLSSRFPSDLKRLAPHYSCGTAQDFNLFLY